ATSAPPVTGDRWQAGDVAYRHAAARMTLQAVVHADEGGVRPAGAHPERHDGRFPQSGDGGRALRCPLGDPLSQRVVAERVLLEVVAILEATRAPHDHHSAPPRARRA